MTAQCSFCDQQVSLGRRVDQLGLYDVICVRCTAYVLAEDALLELQAHPLPPRVKANASGWIREHGGAPIIDVDRLDYFLQRLQTPRASQRAEKLMRHLGQRFPDLNSWQAVDMNDPVLSGVCWALNPEEVQYLLLTYLGESLGFLHCEQHAGSTIRVVILPRGWTYLDDLESPNRDSNTGFIAMWFDDVTRELREYLRAAVEGAGYNAFIIDQHPTNKDIIDEVLAAIRRCRFVVADFTGNRHNVYYEAGFAQGQRTPVIHTCRKDQINAITFDVNHYAFLPWEEGKLSEFSTSLRQHIEVTIGPGPITSRVGAVGA